MANSKTLSTACAALLTLAGAVGSIAFALQPWRSCLGIDDSAAGCPATATDTSFLILSLLVLLVGVVLLVRGLRRKSLPPGAASPN